MHPDAFDITLLTLALVLPLVECFVKPGLERALAGGSQTVRPRLYAAIMAFEWLFTAAIAAAWLAHGRPWSALLLGKPAAWRFLAGLVLAAPAAGLCLYNRFAVMKAAPHRLVRLRTQLRPLEILMPQSVREHRLFGLLSATAGICEEVMYRGFVMWLVAAYTGIPAAAVMQAIVFGVGHVYQGHDAKSIAAAVARTAAAGLFFAGIALAAGSLIPGMIVHALIDAVSGDIALRVHNAAEAKDQYLGTVGSTRFA